jgi:hypothetical protein
MPESQVTLSPKTAPIGGELARRRHAVAQWFGVLGAPIGMLVNLQAQYAVVPWACTRGLVAVLHLSPAICLGIAVGAAVAGSHEWRAGGGGEPGAETGVIARARFLGALGIATSVLFSLIIVSMWLATAFLNPCDGS